MAKWVTIDDVINLVFAARALDTAALTFVGGNFQQKRDEMLELAARVNDHLPDPIERELGREIIEKQTPTPPTGGLSDD